jgi:hypothetical protein
VARLLAVRAAEDGLGEDEQEDVGVTDALAHALEGEQRLPHVQPVVQPELRVREEERADLPRGGAGRREGKKAAAARRKAAAAAAPARQPRPAGRRRV